MTDFTGVSIVGDMAKRQTAEEADRIAAEQAEIDRLEVLEFEADERRKEAEAVAIAEQRIINASQDKKLLKEKCGEHKLYLSKHPDNKGKIAVAVQPKEGCSHTVGCKCEVWAKVDNAKGQRCWQGFRATAVAIKNDAGKIVGWLESR